MLLTLRCEESTRLMSEEFHRDLTPVTPLDDGCLYAQTVVAGA